MLRIILSIFLFSLINNSLFAEDEGLDYFSFSKQDTTFSKESYYDDMQEIVILDEGSTTVIEASPPDIGGFDFSIGAALNNRKQGNSILESFFAGFSKGGWYTSVEKGSVKGNLTPGTQNFSEINRPTDLSFESEITKLTIGKHIRAGLSFGFSYYEMTVPGLWTLSYKRNDSGIANDGVGTYPDQIIDTNYNFKLIGPTIVVDHLKAILVGERPAMAAMFVNTPSNKVYIGWANEIMAGVAIVKPGEGLADQLRTATKSAIFPATVPGVEIVSGNESNAAMGVLLNYELELGWVKKVSDYQFALTGGMRGRMVMNLGGGFDLDDEPENLNEAHIDNREGDFAITFGPYFRFAMTY